MTPNLQALAEIASRDWLILQSALPKLANDIARIPQTTSGPAVWIEFTDFFEMRPPMTIDANGIASIHVHSGLVDSCPPIMEKLGIVTRYETISQEIAAAREAGAKGILLMINSPGGTVRGNVEISQEIADLDLPVVAYASGMACSAAYKIAAGAKYVFASPSAIVGNIGTILSWPNLEAFWQSMGVKWEAITSEGADLKSTFHTEPDERQKAFLQESIDEAGAEFRAHVTAGREAAGAELDPEVFRAGWYSGGKAWSLGLVDAIGTPGQAKAALLSLIDTEPEADPED